MFICRSCKNTKYFVIGKETFWVGRNKTEIWCANIVYCPKCQTFLEPAYETGIRPTINKIEYEPMDHSLIVANDRSKELNHSVRRKLERQGTWA